MKVGVPREVKSDEYRVGLTPAGVRELVDHEHEVIVQAGAGEGSSIFDTDYAAQGAVIVPDAGSVFAACDLIVKVKEPQALEIALLEPRHTLFTYLHLAPAPELTDGARWRARSPPKRALSCFRSRCAAGAPCSAVCPASAPAR